MKVADEFLDALARRPVHVLMFFEIRRYDLINNASISSGEGFVEESAEDSLIHLRFVHL